VALHDKHDHNEQHARSNFMFDVHGSVQLGNVYVRLRVQLDVHGFIGILYSSIFLLNMFRVLFAPILRNTNCSVQPQICVMVMVF
jgi:hypothetical protein